MDARNNNDPRNMFFDQRRDFNSNDAAGAKNNKSAGGKEKTENNAVPAYGAANQLLKNLAKYYEGRARTS